MRRSLLLLVFLGGALRTAARQALGMLFPEASVVPVSIFIANILGAFLLGMLLEALSRRGRDVGRRRSLRLLLGTGFMGGFTTYSALATGTMQLLHSGAMPWALAYPLGTVILGALATWCGIAVGAKWAARSPGGRR
ncbi:CrcB family protein [Glutamicibacter arilaitensis]|uniref:Fluoride-specific ion channel FluC n=1 Tax=Glutamicibacter arilaitensis TaxID=256701 RepID=A0A4Y8TZX5_9MICC|nr:CrcB family protein [Glutamicibacter arilaitensis]